MGCKRKQLCSSTSAPWTCLWAPLFCFCAIYWTEASAFWCFPSITTISVLVMEMFLQSNNVIILICHSSSLSQLRPAWEFGSLTWGMADCFTLTPVCPPPLPSLLSHVCWWLPGMRRGGGRRRKGHIPQELLLLQYGMWAFCHGKCPNYASLLLGLRTPHSHLHPPSPTLYCFLTQAVNFLANVSLTIATRLLPQQYSQRSSHWCNVLSLWLTPGYLPGYCLWLWEILHFSCPPNSLQTGHFPGSHNPCSDFQVTPVLDFDSPREESITIVSTNHSPPSHRDHILPRTLPLCSERRFEFLQLREHPGGYRDIFPCFWQADKHFILHREVSQSPTSRVLMLCPQLWDLNPNSQIIGKASPSLNILLQKDDWWWLQEIIFRMVLGFQELQSTNTKKIKSNHKINDPGLKFSIRTSTPIL